VVFFSTMAPAKVERNTISYMTAISAWKRGRAWQLAVSCLSTMALAKVERDTFTYKTAVGLVSTLTLTQLERNTICYMASISAWTWIRLCRQPPFLLLDAGCRVAGHKGWRIHLGRWEAISAC
jgi:hypothetical protein